MPTPLLSQPQIDALTKVCAIGPDRLGAAADHVDNAGLVIAKARFDALLAKAIGIEDGDELSKFLFSVMVGYRQNHRIADDVLRRIDTQIAMLPNEENLGVWPNCRPALERLLGSESIRLTSKAIDVSYDFERVYMGGRFLTSLRPVFNESREKIMGTAIVQTLRLDFITADGTRTSLSVSLDRFDIEQLQNSCGAALKKAEIAYHTATEEWGIAAMMSGESETDEVGEGLGS